MVYDKVTPPPICNKKMASHSKIWIQKNFVLQNKHLTLDLFFGTAWIQFEYSSFVNHLFWKWHFLTFGGNLIYSFYSSLKNRKYNLTESKPLQ